MSVLQHTKNSDEVTDTKEPQKLFIESSKGLPAIEYSRFVRDTHCPSHPALISDLGYWVGRGMVVGERGGYTGSGGGINAII